MIGITLGEYFGIGPEILLKTFADLQENFPSVKIYGSSILLEQKAQQLGLPRFWETSAHEFVETYQKPVQRNDIKARAEYVLSTLNQAIQDAMTGVTTSIVTCPIDKAVIQNILPKFSGHTEYLAEKSGVKKTVMLLDNKEFSIVLLTNHVSLRNVSSLLTQDHLETTIRTAAASFSKHFNIQKPTIALLGLNPHSGEIDDHSEEKEIFLPVIEKLKKDGLTVQGPYPADSFFPKARTQRWNLVLSPFHDQGLVAAKYNGLEHVINVTLGMPFLRISPGHGVAYDIADQNIADHRSFKRSLQVILKKDLNA